MSLVRATRLYAIPLLALVLGGCASAPSPSPASTAPTPMTTCPGATWPPYDLGGIPGISAASLDRATVELVNATNRTWYYRVAGWKPERFETCQGLLESEVVRGPIAAGSILHVMLGEFDRRLDVPVTIAFWDAPCGESCQRPPIAAILVERSSAEPAASWVEGLSR